MNTTGTAPTIEPFVIAVPQSALDDLAAFFRRFRPVAT